MAVFIKMLSLAVVGIGGASAQLWAVWASRPELFLVVTAINIAFLFLGGVAVGNWKLLVANTVAQSTLGVGAALIGGWQGIGTLFLVGGLITLVTWRSAVSAEAL